MNENSIDCRFLSTENLDDLLYFMEGNAFSDNPVWRECYCVFHYLCDKQDGDWKTRTGSENRSTLIRMVRENQGLWIVAYRKNSIVGWVNADLRPRLKRYDELGVENEPYTGIVACFVVDPGFRLRGIASQLLDAAVNALLARGAKNVDAYVITDPKGLSKKEKDLEADQLAHHGPLTMYLKAGFEVIGQQGAISHVRLVQPVNRELLE